MFFIDLVISITICIKYLSYINVKIEKRLIFFIFSNIYWIIELSLVANYYGKL